MILLSSFDYTVIALYLFAIFAISYLFRAKKFGQFFGETKKPHWIFLASSLLMIEWSPTRDMMSMGLILEEGYSGLWLLKSRFWLAGVPAILYATMWSRLKLQTDNELIRLRFSGKAGVGLHIFRAILLACFVIPLFGSFIILALKKLFFVLQLESHVDPNLFLTVVVLLLVFKNSFRQKIRTDLLTAIICLATPIVVSFFLLEANGGVKGIYESLRIADLQQTALLPTIDAGADSRFIGDFFVFMFVQWWSVYIVDSSDSKAQRHLQAESQFAAFRNLFFPILITNMMLLFVSTVWDCGLLEYISHPKDNIDTEAFYLMITLKYLPDGIKALVLVAIIFSFITTLESIVNWGGALLTIDIYKKYLQKNATDDTCRYFSFFAMFLVSAMSLYCAFHSDKIINIQKFIFSISAGVAPVFLLRWFWWRINAWTQISAMASSLTYTICYDYFYSSNVFVQGGLDSSASALSLSPYPFKVLLLTIMVVTTWVIVMFNTKADDEKHLQEFVRQTGTGGIWPSHFGKSDFQLRKRIKLCILFALANVLPFVSIWSLKFGSTITGIILVILFFCLVLWIYKSMANLLQRKQV